jgi:hypothetical protein
MAYAEGTSPRYMPNPKTKRNSHPPTLAQIERLLVRQTHVILDAVDERLAAQDVRFDAKLAKMERRFTEKLNELTTTLDKFLKRMTDMEEEFTFMKEDLRRVKAVLREKLGVSLD